MADYRLAARLWTDGDGRWAFKVNDENGRSFASGDALGLDDVIELMVPYLRSVHGVQPEGLGLKAARERVGVLLNG